MKKCLMILVAIICFGISVHAKNRYSVSVSTQITYMYYDEQNNLVGSNSAMGQTQTITICADTPDQARSEAMDECSTMCKSYNLKDEGKKPYNGKSYKCKSTREPYEAKVTVSGNC